MIDNPFTRVRGAGRLSLLLMPIILATAYIVVQAEPDDGEPSEFLDALFSRIDRLIQYVSSRLLNLALSIARSMYIAMGALGLLLWATGFNTYRGRQLVLGSIVMALMIEYFSFAA